MLPRVIISVLAILALAVFWRFAAPGKFGGMAEYVITYGDSMEPLLVKNDFAVIRRNVPPEIGKVMLYRSKLTNQTVLHRVIGRQGDRFIFKGDNNDWTDSYRPVEEDIVGELRLHIRGLGKYYKWLRTPWLIGLLGGGTAFVLVGSQKARGRRSKGREEKAIVLGYRHEDRGILSLVVGPAGSLAIWALAAMLVVFGAGAMWLWQKPAIREVTLQVPYQHYVAFDFTAPEPPGGLYDGTIKTGDPVFLDLTPVLRHTFVYELSGDDIQEVTGTVQLFTTVRDVTNWSRTFELYPETPFNGKRVEITFDHDLDSTMKIVTAYQDKSQFAASYFTAAMQAEIKVDAIVDGQAVHEVITPYSVYRIKPPNLMFLETSESYFFETKNPNRIDAKPLHQTFTTLVKKVVGQPNQVSLLGVQLGVKALRVVAWAGIVLSAGGLAVMLLLASVANHRNEVFKIEAKYGQLLIHATGPLQERASRVSVMSMDELVRVARQCDCLITQYADDKTTSYVVEDRGVAYCFEPTLVRQGESNGA